MRSSNITKAVVFTIALPTQNAGYDIAIDSSIAIYKNTFDKVEIIALVPKKLNPSCNLHTDLQVKQIVVPQESKYTRFIKSLLSKFPAVVQQYLSNQLATELRNVLSKSLDESETTFIFEDLPISILMHLIPEMIKSSKIIIRSHNILGEIFDGLILERNLFFSSLFRIEKIKLERFEKRQIQLANFLYTISERDACIYKDKYEIEVEGILSVGIRRKPKCRKTISKNLIYFGTADLRKMQGLKYFIENVWKPILWMYPEASFYLAGKNTDKLTNDKLNIVGLGFIDDSCQIFDKGQIFVNPQISGSGIKLKSIDAMLAAKTLISTEVGVEGICGENGKHFLIASETKQFIDLISQMIDNDKEALRIGKDAQMLANEIYSYNSFLNKKL